MTQKSLAYDHASYITRQIAQLGQTTAGAAASTINTKFVAFTNLQIQSVSAYEVTAGTSTYTAWNGTATVTGINGDSFSLIQITNTATGTATQTATGTTALATFTRGPYQLSQYNGTLTGTQTNIAGVFSNIALGTNTGAGAASNLGGFQANPGDVFYCVRGTDATAVTAFALEYNVQPLANVTA